MPASRSSRCCTGAAVNYGLQLPADHSNIEVAAEWPIPVDVEALAVTPHMHLLGRDIAMSVKYPDGRVEDLVKITDWDFNWQNTYWFEKPLDLPKGTVVRVVAHYDNSASNPRNPNRPAKFVKWGEATTDETCIGFIAVTKKDQDLTRPGEKDDLREILIRQREEFRKKMEKQAKERAAASKVKSVKAGRRQGRLSGFEIDEGRGSRGAVRLSLAP